MIKKLIVISSLIGLIVIACQQNYLTDNNDASHSSVKKIYNESWDSNPIAVIKTDIDEHINTIDDASNVKKLINQLKKADWQENVDVDIRPADYYFKWNSYTHLVWINEETNRLELSIEDKSNYGVLSSSSSEIVFELLIANTYD